MSYRLFNNKNIAPRLAFGHGLSYTTLKYGKVTADKTSMTADGEITLSVDVTNTGSRKGAEVVQLYITDKKCSVDRPAKELKGFEKVSLNPGETATVKFTIKSDALSFFDADAHKWVAEPGVFTARIAAAADDVRTSVDFELK